MNSGDHTPFDRTLIIVVVCGVLLVPVILWFNSMTAEPQNPAVRKARQQAVQRSSDENEARTFAEQFVRQSLKAPSTAKFGPYGSVKAVPMGGGAWTVMGYVDAQNGFGAMIRSDWSVLLQKEGDRWRALSVDVN